MDQKKLELTQDQIDFYHENGYLHIENVFDENYCEELIKQADDFANNHFTILLNLHNHEGFKDVHRGPTLCSIGDALLGKRVIPIGSTFFFCKPNNPNEHGSTWHQDNYAGRAPMNAYLNLALSLDDADESNGSLIIVPKSHKLGDLPCNPKANFTRDDQGRLTNISPIGNDCELPEGLPILQLTYKRGDVLALHAHTVHKANKNPHPSRWRRTMYFVYIKDEEPFWPGWTARRELLDRYDAKF
jgi:ectoine hydroxylase-related dioxygenase (phytanoyl-CoA dioxygenase family)